MSKKTKYSIVSIIAVLLIAILSYRVSQAIGKKKTVAQADPVQTVSTADAANAQKQDYLEQYGNVAAIDQAIVSSKVAGRVSRVLVDNGDAVSAGQQLVALEDQDYRNLVSTSQDTLNKAQSLLTNAQADYDRYKTLYASGAIAQRDLDKAGLAVQVAQADVNSARTGLANAKESLNNAVIKAPIAGAVTGRNVTIGQMLAPGVPLLTVADVSSVYAVVNIKQEDVARIKTGQAAQVMIGDDDSHPLSGTVEIINPVANQAARVFEVKIKVDNKDGLLKPGMMVKTRIITGQPQTVLAIPQDALSGQEGNYYVFVAAGNKAVRRPVAIGATFNRQVEIKSGLTLGEKVIITNVNKLNDQDQIRLAN